MVRSWVAAPLIALVALAAPVEAIWSEAPAQSPSWDVDQRTDGVDLDLSWIVLDRATIDAEAQTLATDEARRVAARADIETHDVADKQHLAKRDGIETPRVETREESAPTSVPASAPDVCTCAEVQAENTNDETRAQVSTAEHDSHVYADHDEPRHAEVESEPLPAPQWIPATLPMTAPAEPTPAPEDTPATPSPPIATDSRDPDPPRTSLVAAATPVHTQPPAAAEIAAAVVVAAAAGAGGGWLLTWPGLRHLRHLVRKGWILALYAKVTKDRLLDHQTRQDILAQVEANPGMHLTELRRTLDLGHGTAAHHLRTLEHNGLITSVRSGRRRCYFVPGANDRRLAAVLGSPAARRVYELIQQHPGILQREIATQLGVTPTAVIFQVRRLQQTGAVQKTRVGREVAYFPGVTA